MCGARWLVLLLLVPAIMGADTALDEYPRRIGIDVENYRFELTLSDETDEIVGRVTVSIRFRTNGVATLPLDQRRR